METVSQALDIKKEQKKNAFDLSSELLNVKQKLNQNNQVEANLFLKLIQDLNINARQKLKHYKKILESSEKQNLSAEKDFINKYLKNILLKQYLMGNTQGKPALLNLLKKFNIISFDDIIQSRKQIRIQTFEQIRIWSQIVDLCFRVFHQKSSKQQYLSFQNILNNLYKQIITGQQSICKNQFKTKWLSTFTQILRTENLLMRIFNQHINQQTKQRIKRSCKQIIRRSSYLSKQVITQLHLLLIFLSPQQPEPSTQNHLCLIFYYHAQSVVLGKNTLKELLSLIPRLKETEHKCQLTPLLQQSFITHYSKFNNQDNKQFRSNVFDQVINLFDVGRTIYSYLQNIVKIIIQNGDEWNMQGNFIRKFFISTIVLKFMPTKSIIEQWHTIVQDVIVQCGNMSVPYAIDCATILFQKLYEQNQKDYFKWSAYWLDCYKKKLFASNQKNSVRGVIQFINPILLKICSKPFLLKDLLSISDTQSNQNLQLGIISLIKCYKQIGQIEVNQNQQNFHHSQDKEIKFSYNKIKNFLLSNDQMIAIQAFQLISNSLKPSQLIKPIEMNLCLQYYRYSLKTSNPQYRKNYLAATKKLFERFRNIYDSHLISNQKKPCKKLYFADFVNFLKQLVKICFRNIFPDAIFQLVNPGLEILQLLQSYFGNRRTQIKKGVFLEATSVLNQTSFYVFQNFQNLLTCLECSYESVRKLAHDLLNYFNDIKRQELLKQLWFKCLQNTNKLAIRSYEYACRVLTFISEVYPNVLNLEKEYQLNELNVLNYFLKLTKQRFIVFKDQFLNQGSNYYKNLVHGLLTILAYQINKLASQIGDQVIYQRKYLNFSNQINQFLQQFFNQLIDMLNFAVQISSSNVSTVVLDTLTQGSQSDKKLKVDCRGHFLLQNTEKTTNVGTFLQSTALISSMEDDEEGIQNTLVVSFYLLTRQAGLVFQSIGQLLSNKNYNQYIPSQNLLKLINTYFYSLINLKHMGSIDRIAKGLGKMSRVIFDHESKQLSQLPQSLIIKLLNHLKDGKFTTILRRSAGIPFAICCLLKSQALKRNKLIQRTVTELLQLSKESSINSIQLRVHSLNILKKLFQDSDLKIDLDPYLSDAFISSIKGFTSQQWGVRNSSLMLFSTLANRTVGIKPIYNLLQFFIKCPALFDFIQNQIRNFKEQSLNTMYPPLYPIVLLFSRLLPFDLKQKSKIIPQNNMKHVRKQELLSLLPILDKSGLNNNYMGRIMTAKAILPFMQMNQIYEYCVLGLENLPQHFNKNNNILHYQLAKYNHLLISHQQICVNSARSLQVSDNILQRLYKFIVQNIETISKLNCAVVLEYFIKIIHYFFEIFSQRMSKNYGQNYSKIILLLSEVLKQINNKYIFQTQSLVIYEDLGHSMMRKRSVSFHFELLIKYTNNFDEFKKLAIQFTEFISNKLQNNEIFFQTSDNQICELYFQNILKNIQILKSQQKAELFKSLIHMLQKLELDKIRSDIILSKILQLRIASQYHSLQNKKQITFLINLEKESNNHFLKISIFKYLVFVRISQDQILKLLFQFSDPKSLQELRQCTVEYLQTQPKFNKKLSIVHVRLLEDEQYEIRKNTAAILSKQMKTYQYNQAFLKNQILKDISPSDIRQILVQNSDFNIKRKNHEEQRIFAYDKPNKFRSDINTLVQIMINNQSVLNDLQSISNIFSESLNEKQKVIDIINVYENNILSRNEYQFELIVRQLISHANDIFNNKQKENKFKKISNSHPLISQIYQKIIVRANNQQ